MAEALRCQPFLFELIDRMDNDADRVDALEGAVVCVLYFGTVVFRYGPRWTLCQAPMTRHTGGGDTVVSCT